MTDRDFARALGTGGKRAALATRAVRRCKVVTKENGSYTAVYRGQTMRFDSVWPGIINDGEWATLSYQDGSLVISGPSVNNAG